MTHLLPRRISYPQQPELLRYRISHRKDTSENSLSHDDVIKWKHFPRNWPFVREIHRSPVNFPHKGQRRGALMFSLIYAWINDWVNNREAGDLRRQHGHYDVIVMYIISQLSNHLNCVQSTSVTHTVVICAKLTKCNRCYEGIEIYEMLEGYSKLQQSQFRNYIYYNSISISSSSSNSSSNSSRFSWCSSRCSSRWSRCSRCSSSRCSGCSWCCTQITAACECEKNAIGMLDMTSPTQSNTKTVLVVS